MPVSKKKSDNEPVGEDPCRLRLRGRSETTDEPAETEKKSAREKDTADPFEIHVDSLKLDRMKADSTKLRSINREEDAFKLNAKVSQ